LNSRQSAVANTSSTSQWLGAANIQNILEATKNMAA
jgi:hypothetical protein